MLIVLRHTQPLFYYTDYRNCFGLFVHHQARIDINIQFLHEFEHYVYGVYL
jgi:hypothetical protein